MRIKKILVTGANGTLGSAILELLKQKKINHVGVFSKKTDMTNLKN